MGTTDIREFTDSCGVGLGETIALSTVFYEKKKLLTVAINWAAGVAPTTSENLVITLNSSQGAAYDTIIFDQDMSTLGGGVIDLILTSDDFGDLVMGPEDEIDCAYTNTDDLGIGLVVTMEPGY